MMWTRTRVVGYAAGIVAALLFITQVRYALWTPRKPELPPDELMKKTILSYAAQERSIAAGHAHLDTLDLVSSKNSDPLPPRLFSGDAPSMCAREDAACVPDRVNLKPLLVTSPDHRLASCIIQKSMSTIMSALFCFLTRQEEFIAQGRSLIREYADISLCQHKNEFNSMYELQYAYGLSDADLDRWRFTMVTRDPVDRFLSGFIDRCIRVADSCFGCQHNMTCFMIEEHKRMLEYARVSKWRSLKMSMEDIHTFPQNWRCHMDKYGERYELLKYSNDVNDGFLNQLLTVLRQRNVSESSISFVTESMSSGRTAHSTVTSPARVYLEKRLRESPFLMELITRMFYYDYTKLNYPLPTL